MNMSSLGALPRKSSQMAVPVLKQCDGRPAISGQLKATDHKVMLSALTALAVDSGTALLTWLIFAHTNHVL